MTEYKKLRDCFDKDQLAKLKQIRDELPPLVYLPRRPPNGHWFACILPHIGDDKYWAELVGRTCKVVIRNEVSFKARLDHIVFRRYEQLTEDDARFAGIRSDTPLEDLKQSLDRWLTGKPFWPVWKGKTTDLQILFLERI